MKWKRSQIRTARRLGALALLWVGGVGLARSDTDETALPQAQPLSLVSLLAEGAAFRLPEGSGRYLTTTFRGDYAPSEVFSFGIRVPYEILELQGGGTRTGLGDLSLVLKLRLASFTGGAISIGLASQLPTGSPQKGLGDGHVLLAPFIRMNFWFDVITIQLNVADDITLPGGPNFPSYIDPHTNHELNYQVGLGFELFRHLLLLGILDGVTVLEPAQRWLTLFTAGPQLRLSLTDHWQLFGNAQFPVYGPHRAEWRANAGLQCTF